MTDRAHLTSLPLELIQKIASLCPLSDVLALCHSCRELYNICSHEFVKQESLINTIRDATSNDSLEKAALRKSFVARVVSKATWDRLAIAASNVPSLINHLESALQPYESVPWDLDRAFTPEPFHQDDGSVMNIIGVLSTLTVLGYPTINNFTVTAALTGLATRLFDGRFWNPSREAPDRPGPDDVLIPFNFPPQMAFCLATGALENRVLNNMAMLCSFLELHVTHQDPLGIPPDFVNSFQGQQTYALLITVCMRWILHSDPSVRTRNDLPHSASLPFLNVVGRSDHIPLPDGESRSGAPIAEDEEMDTVRRLTGFTLKSFSLAPSWPQWLRNNIDALIDDMGNGEWMGYYTQTVGLSDVDDPLRGIHFSVTPNPSNDDELLLSAKDCVYTWGNFSLRGTVHRPSGRVRLTRDPADSWHIDGVMTPLGIAGTVEAGNLEVGFIWIFKTEWARRDVRREGLGDGRGAVGGPRTVSSLHFLI